MFDVVKLILQAGDGGHGKVSFHRAKFIPKGGPDGGDGGDGGSVYLKGSKQLNTLQSFAGAKEFDAERGDDGHKEQMIGKKGQDIVLEVPIGTTVWLVGENKASRNHRLFAAREGAVKPPVHFRKYYLEKPQGGAPPLPVDEILPVQVSDAEMTAENGEGPSSDDRQYSLLRSSSIKNINLSELEKVKLLEITDEEPRKICSGGFGGRGNMAFKGPANTTPFEAEYGTLGEKRVVILELKLFADIGLIGYPNAGKSTLLSILTKANPKIANYPFTTLEPNLGVMSSGHRDLVLADIPGLIEGASQGKGLGFDFLRHVEGCKALAYILSLDESLIFDDKQTPESLAEELFLQYKTLKHELKEYNELLIGKSTLIFLSKSDLYTQEQKDAIAAFFSEKKIPIYFFSAVTKTGLEELQNLLDQIA